MPSETVVDLSRLQFALTAMFHFLFVPLTLGLSWLLVIMESVYVMIGKEIYKDMTRFWGKLFGINFAMGITTGITLEFQFGTNWAYYSHYVGDVFGVSLAIEGMMDCRCSRLSFPRRASRMQASRFGTRYQVMQRCKSCSGSSLSCYRSSSSTRGGCTGCWAARYR